MAITRTQIAKQLLAQGGRIGYAIGGRENGNVGTTGPTGNKGGDGDGDARENRRGDQYSSVEGKAVADKNERDARNEAFRDAFTKSLTKQSRKASLDNLRGFLPGGKYSLTGLAVRGIRGIAGMFGPKDLGIRDGYNMANISGPTTTDDDDDTGNGDGQSIILPETLMAQAPSIVEQEPEIEEEEPFEFYRRFRADGGMADDSMPYEGGIMDLESARQMYGLGKLVKKVTRSVKKIAKSPIGKAALLYTVGGGLGSMAGGQGFFSSFMSPMNQIRGMGSIFSRQGLSNIASKVGLGSFENVGSNRIFQKNLLGKVLTSPSGLIAGTSLLAGGLTAAQEEEAQEISDETGIDIAEIRANPDKYLARRFKAEGGSMDEPVAKKTMPLLDMDGQEMDLRAEGGFVPLGRMEKADDVPARLSKNEFVFTADAVRNAGEGDVDKGAEVMYNMMKNLESGGDVSEESQGLEGARDMFKTSQRLEEVL